jgi:hypothetical protein
MLTNPQNFNKGSVPAQSRPVEADILAFNVILSGSPSEGVVSDGVTKRRRSTEIVTPVNSPIHAWLSFGLPDRCVPAGGREYSTATHHIPDPDPHRSIGP